MPETTETSIIRKILVTKRAQMPADAYFDGILAEFHRRQQLSASQTLSIFETLRQSFTNPFLATGQAVAVLALLLAFGFAFQPDFSNVDDGQFAQLATADANNYSLIDDMVFVDPTSQLLSVPDGTLQTVDRVVSKFEKASFSELLDQPRYVLSPDSATTDAALTF